MSKFWSKKVHALTPYIPGEQPKSTQLIKLNTNENPYPPSPKVVSTIQAATDSKLALYPDPTSSQLRGVIADYYDLTAEQVFVGNGSDEVLAHVFNALFVHDEPILFPEITYSFYPVYCGLFDIDYKQVTLANDFSIQWQDYLQANGGIIFPNPNAPTGMATPLDQIEKLLRQNTESVVVVDEAYVDFGAASAVQLVKQYPNLLVTQTVSKSRSLAGLRLGYAMGHSDLIEGLVRVKDSFNSYPIDRLAEAGAMAAFTDREYFESTRQMVMQTRKQFIGEATQMGFEMLPSAANFVFMQHPKHSGEVLASALRENNIIIRHFKKPLSIANYLRVTIGTPEQMQTLLSILRQII